MPANLSDTPSRRNLLILPISRLWEIQDISEKEKAKLIGMNSERSAWAVVSWSCAVICWHTDHWNLTQPWAVLLLAGFFREHKTSSPLLYLHAYGRNDSFWTSSAGPHVLWIKNGHGSPHSSIFSVIIDATRFPSSRCWDHSSLLFHSSGIQVKRHLLCYYSAYDLFDSLEI